jgi:L-lactate dehydrogenase complex protein LldE
MPAGTPVAKASLFVTCLVDQFYPEVGESTVRVLRRLGVDLDFPPEQTCCGQTAFNAGYWSEARPLARRFLTVFRGDRYIVAPSGSCASMVRNFYAELLHDDPDVLEEWRGLAPRVFELSEFIVDVLGVSDLGGPGAGRRVTYHEACHLRRELGVTAQPRALLKAVPGLDLVEMDQAEVCCGFGGTFSVKYADISGAMLQDKLDNIAKTGADTLTACDSSCLMHLAGGMDKQGMDVRPMHLAEILDEALGPDRRR